MAFQAVGPSHLKPFPPRKMPKQATTMDDLKNGAAVTRGNLRMTFEVDTFWVRGFLPDERYISAYFRNRTHATKLLANAWPMHHLRAIPMVRKYNEMFRCLSKLRAMGVDPKLCAELEGTLCELAVHIEAYVHATGTVEGRFYEGRLKDSLTCAVNVTWRNTAQS